jgi:hypothetical protein
VGEETFLKIRTNIQTGILRTDAAAKFFTTKILIVDFKSIKQKTVETEMGIFKRFI